MNQASQEKDRLKEEFLDGLKKRNAVFGVLKNINDRFLQHDDLGLNLEVLKLRLGRALPKFDAHLAKLNTNTVNETNIIDKLPLENGHDLTFYLSEVEKWKANLDNFRSIALEINNLLFNRSRNMGKRSRKYEKADLVPANQPVGERRALEILKNHNMLHSLLEIASGSHKADSIPTFWLIDPSSACNYACLMCEHSVNNVTSKKLYVEISPEIIASLKPFMRFAKYVLTSLTGEPLLASEYENLVYALKESGCYTQTITNGSLLRDKAKEVSRLDELIVSIDGSNSRTIKTQRRGANLEKILDGIRAVRENNPKQFISFNVCVTRFNMDELPDIVRLAAELGVLKVQFIAMRVSLPANAPDIGVHLEDMDYLSSKIHEAMVVGKATGVEIANLIAINVSSGPVQPPFHKNELMRRVSAQPRPPRRGLREAIARFEAIPFEIMPSFIYEDISNEANQFFSDNDLVDVYANCGVTRKSASFEERPDSSAEVRALINDLISKIYRGERIHLPYCLAPWTDLVVMVKGYCFPCCNGAGLTSNMNMKKGDLDILKKGGLDKTLNSTFYTELRSSFNGANDIPDICAKCDNERRYSTVSNVLTLLGLLGSRWEQIVFPDNYSPTLGVGKLEDVFNKAHSNASIRLIPGVPSALDNPSFSGGFRGNVIYHGNRRLFLAKEGIFAVSLECAGVEPHKTTGNFQIEMEMGLLPDISLTDPVDIHVWANGVYEGNAQINQNQASYLELTLAPDVLLRDGHVNLVFYAPALFNSLDLKPQPNSSTGGILISKALLLVQPD